MKNKIRKIDNLGRITLPADFRKDMNLKEFEELEIITDGNSIVLRKKNNPDVFGNISENEPYFEYHGRRVSKKSIIELSEIAGLL